MHKVTISKSGLYFSFWDQTEETWVEKNILDATVPISWYLSYPIQFTDSLTVREMIKLIEPYAKDLGLIMIHELAGVDISKILELSNTHKSQLNQIEPEAVYLVKIAEATPTVQNDEEFNFLSMYPVLIGLKEVDETGDNDEVFSLTSIDFLDWCDLPFELDDYIEYINPANEEVLFEGVMNWTLGEVIGTILSQTSVTLQIMQNSVIPSDSTGEPVQIDSIFKWFEDLDRVLLR
jgi:hypothetical protein